MGATYSFLYYVSIHVLKFHMEFYYLSNYVPEGVKSRIMEDFKMIVRKYGKPDREAFIRRLEGSGRILEFTDISITEQDFVEKRKLEEGKK